MLTHHWLIGRRGGEKVLEAIAEVLPRAELYTFLHDPQMPGALAQRRIVTSLLQRIPGATRRHSALLPLMPAAAGLLRVPPVELAVCSDAALAKAFRVHGRTTLVCYCHSPMRYVWEEHIAAQYAATLPALLRPVFRLTRNWLKRVDAAAAKRVDVFIANSRCVAERIERCYRRQAQVIHPPVELPPAPVERRREEFLLCAGYHAPYKRLDLAVAAAAALGRRLVVIGGGPSVPAARRLAEQLGSQSTVEFLGSQPDHVLHDHYARAAALLFPGEEDFGIVPVEAMAHGCPVLAYGAGGAQESVIHGETGLLFNPQTQAALADMIRECERSRFNPRAMWLHAQRFSLPRFKQEIRAALVAALADSRVERTARGR